MSNNILFVFEGERTEKQIADSLTNYFVNENTIVQCAYCNNIYHLHKELSNDEDLDTFLLLKEISLNSEILASYSRKDFAEIYLFFDYDGQDRNADDEKIEEMISFFDEETSAGKLFISYPMVEALKHISDVINFKELKVEARKNIQYKRIVSDVCDNKFSDFTIYSREIWIFLIEIHLKKMNFITCDDYSLPTLSKSQNEIFAKQLEKYIDIDSTVAVLSAFPVFVFDYYGYRFISKLLS